MNKMREPFFRATTEHANWVQKIEEKTWHTLLRQTVEEKMAGLTGLLGTLLICHLFNNPHNQSYTKFFYIYKKKKKKIEHSII